MSVEVPSVSIWNRLEAGSQAFVSNVVPSGGGWVTAWQTQDETSASVSHCQQNVDGEGNLCGRQLFVHLTGSADHSLQTAALEETRWAQVWMQDGDVTDVLVNVGTEPGLWNDDPVRNRPFLQACTPDNAPIGSEAIFFEQTGGTLGSLNRGMFLTATPLWAWQGGLCFELYWADEGYEAGSFTGTKGRSAVEGITSSGLFEFADADGAFGNIADASSLTLQRVGMDVASPFYQSDYESLIPGGLVHAVLGFRCENHGEERQNVICFEVMIIGGDCGNRDALIHVAVHELGRAHKTPLMTSQQAH